MVLIWKLATFKTLRKGLRNVLTNASHLRIPATALIERPLAPIDVEQQSRGRGNRTTKMLVLYWSTKHAWLFASINAKMWGGSRFRWMAKTLFDKCVVMYTTRM